ncbi:MAG: hypothetical protein QOI74_481 [Micromonosporaceae bacterium]|nr:hypothetical protein [Micromonosporaceae bacterium]
MIADKLLLVERANELKVVDAAVAQLARGHGALLVFEGPPGSGRTHLLRVLAERVSARGARALRGRAGHGDRGFPFGLIHQLVEPWLSQADPAERTSAFAGGARLATGLFDYAAGDLPDEPPPAGLHQPLYGLYWLLRNIAQHGPLVLVIDDLQWADTPSLHFVRYLAERLDDMPVLILASAVPHEHGATADILQEAFTAPWTHVIGVRPLSGAGTQAVVAALLEAPAEARFAAACHELSAGNPYLLHELVVDLRWRKVQPVDAEVAAVHATLPRSVVRRVRSWLLRLPEPAARLARAFAVLGGGGLLRHAAEVAGLEPPVAADAVRILSLVGLLGAADGEEPRLAHPLVSAAIYDDLAPGFRTRAHDRIARMFAAEGLRLDQIADHLLPTRPVASRWVVDVLRAAARCGSVETDPVRSAAWLARALAEPPPDGERAAVLAELGAAERRARDGAAIGHLAAALAGAEEPALLNTVRRELGLALTAAGRFTEALVALDGAADGTDGAGALPCLAADAIAVAQLTPGTRGKATEWLRHVPADHDEFALAACRAVEEMARGGDAADVARYAERALDETRGPLPPADSETLAGCLAAWMLIACDRHATAERAIQNVRQLMTGANLPLAATMAECLEARLSLDYGRLGEAEALAHGVLARTADCELSGLAGPLASAALVDTLREGGRLAEAADRLAGCAPQDWTPESVAAVPLLRARARVRLARGDITAAVADLRGVDLLIQAWGPATLGYGAHRAELVVALTRLGDLEGARELALDAVEAARRFGAQRLLAAALRACCLTTTDRDGLAMLQEAVTLLDGSPYPLDRAAALIDLGAALRRAGRRGDARARLQAAIELAGHCGAIALRDHALGELSVAGGRVRRDRHADPTSLTPAELRVVRMAADGMRNGEIARTLFVSVKAVEWHLSHAYPKLGVRNRHELPRVLSAGTNLLDGG